MFSTALLLALSLQSTTADPYPLAATVSTVRGHLETATIIPTGLSRADYLTTIQGIVDYFKNHQSASGRIIDPYLKREFQYSTPCFAWAASVLVVHGGRPDLLPRASAALEAALSELAADKVADDHGDFFTFPSMLAYEQLKDRVPPDRKKKWEALIRAIDPSRVYQFTLDAGKPTLHNWNVVNLAGEFLRHRAGFVDLSFVERHIPVQLRRFTAEGLYRDPEVPMAYDHFPRQFFAVMLGRGYDGRYKSTLERLIDRGAWTSLLMQSSTGEWPTGGRSAQHTWNEAMQAVTYEIWAARKEREGDHMAAAAFKRAARLALQSVRRWIRPSGELWIVKNRFDPSDRHGFETYSSHSQYNLLTASLLAVAWQQADDTVQEGPSPADIGGFAFRLPAFHKIIANAGGLYVEIETAADPRYDSTGLVRVQRAGVDSLVGPTDGSPINGEALAVGVAWPMQSGWKSLAELSHPGVDFTVASAAPQRVRFTVSYRTVAPRAITVVESYELTPTSVRVAVDVQGSGPSLQIRFPVLTTDGARSLRITVSGSSVRVDLGSSRETFRVESPPGVTLARSNKRVACRNGFLDAVVGTVDGRRVTYVLTPEVVR